MAFSEPRALVDCGAVLAPGEIKSVVKWSDERDDERMLQGPNLDSRRPVEGPDESSENIHAPRADSSSPIDKKRPERVPHSPRNSKAYTT